MLKKPFFIKRLWLILLAIGPGIFGIGYTIGTGSVTTMVSAGSQFGITLWWDLFLACLFSYVLLEAYGRYAIVTGRTTINSFKTELKFGKALAIATMAGVIIGQWGSYSGIVGICSNGIYETIRLFVPGLNPQNYWAVLSIAIIILLTMYAFIWVGRYSFFEKLLVVLVTLMGICFLITMFVVLPSGKDIASGLIPSIPKVKNPGLLIAAFVGTTMAAPTFVVRPLTIIGHGWGKNNIKEQRRDAFAAAFFIFLISLSIMVCAAGALFPRGIIVTKVLDMVGTLEPLVGKLSVALFLVGLVSAGLTSTFPIMMVAALLLADYREGKLDTSSVVFKALAGLACVAGLIIPVLGTQPIVAQIITQVVCVPVLPIVVLGITILVNRKNIMGQHKAGLLLNIGLAGAFIFSCIISYIAIDALVKSFS